MSNNLTERATVNKNIFIKILRDNVRRPGMEKMISWLSEETDFFEAPASTKFHGAEEGGLCAHSISVYYLLESYYKFRENDLNFHMVDNESIAIAALLHDVCKIGCYHKGTKNVKDSQGKWYKEEIYTFNDPMPFGHGEKSVWEIFKFIRLSDEEAFAIRYHMGAFQAEDVKNLSKVYSKYPLAFALSVADMESTYYLEDRKEG